MRIAREGFRFILPSLGLGIVLAVIGWRPLAVLFILLAGAFSFFFRDPERTALPDESLILSPADGKVLRLEETPGSSGLPSPGKRIAIFLSLFDVHLTRAPLSGTVENVEYRAGKFFPAYRDEASLQNESNTLFFRTGAGRVVLKQMVGVAARRIKCFVKAGDEVRRGQRIGLMYFGSRVELDLPPGVEIKAAPGQKVKGGETVIAEVKP